MNVHSAGVGLIALERDRQVMTEGYSPQHDDEHTNGELCGAAAAYAFVAHRQIGMGDNYSPTTVPPSQTWRWSGASWKTDYRPRT